MGTWLILISWVGKTWLISRVFLSRCSIIKCLKPITIWVIIIFLIPIRKLRRKFAKLHSWLANSWFLNIRDIPICLWLFLYKAQIEDGFLNNSTTLKQISPKILELNSFLFIATMSSMITFFTSNTMKSIQSFIILTESSLAADQIIAYSPTIELAK